MDLVKQYRENKAKIEAIWAEDEKFIEAKDKEISELERAYRDKKWALEEEERTKVNAMQQEKEEYHEAARKQVEDLHKVIEQVDRILYFLKLKPDVTWKEEELKAREGKQLVRLGALYQDEYLDIRLYIVENDRPKNKYTLFAKGKCAFGSPSGWEPSNILELPRAYDLYLNDYGAGDNVECVFAHLPTIDDVKQYVAKHPNELMREFLVKYRKVKREYLETLRTYRLEEFAGIEPE